MVADPHLSPLPELLLDISFSQDDFLGIFFLLLSLRSRSGGSTLADAINPFPCDDVCVCLSVWSVY